MLQGSIIQFQVFKLRNFVNIWKILIFVNINNVNKNKFCNDNLINFSNEITSLSCQSQAQLITLTFETGDFDMATPWSDEIFT